MPYVITTSNPTLRAAFDEAGGRGIDLAERIDAAESRIAVATADDARRAIIAIGEQHDTWIGGDALHGPIDRNGGTVGPLPDGTVIEVQPVDWVTFGRDVRERLGYQGGGWKDIAAFNADAR